MTAHTPDVCPDCLPDGTCPYRPTDPAPGPVGSVEVREASWGWRLAAPSTRQEAVQDIAREHSHGGSSVRRTAIRLGVREATLRDWAALVPELAQTLGLEGRG